MSSKRAWGQYCQEHMVVHQSSPMFNTSTKNQPEFIDVDVLLPKPMGIVITVKCDIDTRFEVVKDKVWQKISNMMDFGEKDKFSFEGINNLAILERFEDDKVKISESELFYPMLKLVKKSLVDKVDQRYVGILSMLCGRNVTMDVAKHPSLEVLRFTELMDDTSHNYNKLRDSYDYRTLLKIKYPLNTFDLDPGILEFENQYNVLQYSIYIESSHKLVPNSEFGNWELSENFLVPFRAKVQLMLDVLIEVEKLVTTNSYVFKVSGQEDFFFDDSMILPQYKYIQTCIRNNAIPALVLTTYEDLRKSHQLLCEPKNTENITYDEIFPISPLHYTQPFGYDCVSQIREKYSICIRSLSDLDLDRNNKICVYVALYSGHHRLEQLQTTEKVITSVIEWNETLTFGIDIADLPRNAKLCFSIQRRRRADGSKKNKKESADTFSLNWINMTVFDFQGTLRSGRQDQHVWTCLDTNTGFNFTGTCFPYSLADTPIFTVALPEPSPPVSFYLTAAARQMALDKSGPNSLAAAEDVELTEENKERLEKLLGHSYRSNQIEEEDSSFLWEHRVHCLQYPQSLPKLVDSKIFDSLEKTSQLYTLLLDWPEITVATALQLLHMHITDPHVREFAIYSLDSKLSDDMMNIFSLQLVECLKYDLYLDCALLRFLLKRALRNNILGHELYWHLKSQVDSPEFGVQFAMYIEFYLRCCGDHVEELNKMSNSMSKIGAHYEKIIKLSKDELKVNVGMSPTSNAFCGEICMTKPRYRCKEIVHDKTKVFDSSKRPMLLTFANQDPTNNEVFGMIYKEGDDLRQDQLVLQMINLINRIWLKENLDMRLIVFATHCIRKKTGVIELIKADTLFSIIKTFRTLSAIEIWLRDKNPHQLDFEECRQNFIKSCCGYSLIQYVLGIADRHPSNIMLAEDGRLVHIDFGHILGYTKTFLRINREPSPFIFMKEFEELISLNGEDEFKKFEQLFVKAYLVLRKHSEELLTLFHLMISAGLKELNEGAIIYFKNAMCVGLSDDDAERKILKLLHDSINMTKKQQLHWLAHVVAHA